MLGLNKRKQAKLFGTALTVVGGPVCTVVVVLVMVVGAVGHVEELVVAPNRWGGLRSTAARRRSYGRSLLRAGLRAVQLLTAV